MFHSLQNLNDESHVSCFCGGLNKMMAMTRAVKIALCGSEDSGSIAGRQDRGLPLYNFLTDVQDILNPPEYHWCYRDLSCDASTWAAHYAGKVSTKFRGSGSFHNIRRRRY